MSHFEHAKQSAMAVNQEMHAVELGSDEWYQLYQEQLLVDLTEDEQRTWPATQKERRLTAFWWPDIVAALDVFEEPFKKIGPGRFINLCNKSVRHSQLRRLAGPNHRAVFQGCSPHAYH